MGEDDFVTESRCKERCKTHNGRMRGIELTSKETDTDIKTWLEKGFDKVDEQMKGFDGKLWGIIIAILVTLAAVVFK
ncbi:MAG: hypothetical protein KAV87_63325 [Desulfobacteraceae bacterium]|nr:hypothetical protein [Desulfobacteraceae bacterium]